MALSCSDSIRRLPSVGLEASQFALSGDLRRLHAAMRPPLLFSPLERAYFTRRQHRFYRLGSWPELAGDVGVRGGAGWIPSGRAARRVLEAVAASTSGWPRGLWFGGRVFDQVSSGKAIPRLRWTGETWVERETEQTVFPWGSSETNEVICADQYDAAREFQRDIPGAFRLIAKRYRNGHIAILRLLSAVPESEQLHHSNPALFYLLAGRLDRTRASDVPRQAVLAMLRSPRRQVLSFCVGYATSSAAVRLIARAPHRFLSSPEKVVNLALAPLQPVFGHCLAHVRELPIALAEVLSRPALWSILTPPLIGEILRRPEAFGEEVPAFFLQRAADAAQRLRQREGRSISRFRSAGEVREFLEKAHAANFRPATAAARVFDDQMALPPAPFPSNSELVPIRTVGELREEGMRQENCAGEDWQIALAIKGERHFFAMHKPERATLMVERTVPQSGSPWIISELRTQGNGIPRFSSVVHATRILGIPAQPFWHLPPQACWWTVEQPYSFMPDHPLEEIVAG